MPEIINWEALAELGRFRMPGGTGMWSEWAEKYDGFAKLEKEYTERQIALMHLEPEDTAIDIGCGPGRISIPVARRVKRVTSLDVSQAMLDECLDNARENGLTNINGVLLDWEEVVPGQNVPVHDVVIASRSPAWQDLAKVNALARKRVYLLTFAGSSLKDFHDELVEGIVEPPQQQQPRPPGMGRSTTSGYMLTFNRLFAMGIDASLQYVIDGFTRWYPDREAAYADFEWLRVPADKQQRFRQNIDRFLSDEKGGVRLRKETRTVVIAWEKAA